MPDYQDPRAKALHIEAMALYDEASLAETEAEREALVQQAIAKDREADKIEHGPRHAQGA